MKNFVSFLLPLLFMVMLSGCANKRIASEDWSYTKSPSPVTTPPRDPCPGRPTPIATCPEVAPQAYAKKKYINSIGMEFVLISPGCFVMGSNDGEANEKPLHAVQITKGVWMQTTEVTQEQWSRIMGSNPSKFRGKNLPVEWVSWDDTKEFIAKLNAKENASYRLPSEAEWEYACRGGKAGETYCGGNDLDAVAWHKANADNRTHPVASKRANGYGLYDMSGNVWEWVSDWYDTSYYCRSPKEDPLSIKTDADSDRRVMRGGSWYYWFNDERIERAAYRARDYPSFKSRGIGFRLAMPSGQ